jgi:hypothetical protein
MARKKGNQFPKKGNLLPLSTDAGAAMSYETLISAALRRELGGSHKAVKTLMRWTGASARTAKNWLSGSVGPRGAHLILLMKFSDAVFETILSVAKRRTPGAPESALAARLLLAEALSLLNQ